MPRRLGVEDLENADESPGEEISEDDARPVTVPRDED